MSNNKPIHLKDFNATKLHISKITKDIYGGNKFSLSYEGNTKQQQTVIRIEAPIFTYGASHIKDFVNKDLNTGKFQMTCLPYKTGGVLPDKNNESELLFYNNFEKALLDRILKLAVTCPAKFGFDSKIHNNDLIKSLIKDIVWRRKEKRNEEGKIIAESGSTSYLYLKLRSKNLKDTKSASFSDITTPFYSKNKDRIDPCELSNKMYNLYADIVIQGLYQKQKAGPILLQYSLKVGFLEELKQDEESYAREF